MTAFLRIISLFNGTLFAVLTFFLLVLYFITWKAKWYEIVFGWRRSMRF